MDLFKIPQDLLIMTVISIVLKIDRYYILSSNKSVTAPVTLLFELMVCRVYQGL